MFKRVKRDRHMLAMLLAGAMVISSCIPVMGGEAAVEDLESSNLMDAGDYELDAVGQVEAIEDSAFGSDSDDGVSLQESNVSSSENYYYGTIYVTNDGIYDTLISYGIGDAAHRLNIPGIIYDDVSHTLSLNNFSLGSVTDGYMDEEKAGNLYIQCDYTDLTIHLEGHNYIGGYSVSSRATLYNGNNNWNSYFVNPYGIALFGFASSLTFEGSGDLLINGSVEVYQSHFPKIDDRSDIFNREYVKTDFRTALPVWSTVDFEGANLRSISINDDGFQPGKVPFHSRKAAWDDYCGYTKIGGEKPETMEKPEPYVTVSKNLGEIAGHSVIVYYEDNIPYNGKKIVNNGNCKFYYNITSGKVEFYNPLDEEYGYYDTISSVSSSYTNPWFDDRLSLGNVIMPNAGNSKSKDMNLTLYVDGKPVRNSVITVKYSNNRNVINMRSGKSVSPCFALRIRKAGVCPRLIRKEVNERIKNHNKYVSSNSINPGDINIDQLMQQMKDSELDDSFIKAFNAYFKVKENWISFTITPIDIKYANFKGKEKQLESFYSLYRANCIGDGRISAVGIWQDPTGISLSGYADNTAQAILRDYKNSVVFKNGSISRFPLCGEDHVKNKKHYASALKIDKKYVEGNPNLKKDFHVTVSDNCLIVTGQGNYINSIIVPNPHS